MKLQEIFNIKAMTDDQLFHLFYMGQQMADTMDRRGDAKGCEEYSELWVAVDDLLTARGAWA